MERFWKWLMKMDAKKIFLLSLALFIAVAAWRAYDIVQLLQKGDDSVLANAKPKPADFAKYQPIGIIGFVSNQFSPDTLIVPVNPFHPSFEEIVRSIVSQGGTNVVVFTRRDGGTSLIPLPPGQDRPVLVDEKGRPFQGPFRRPGQQSGSDGARSGGGGGFRSGGNRPAQGHGGAAQPAEGPKPPPPKPRVAFLGMMQRPDGQFAAYISDTGGRNRFVVVSNHVHDAVVVESGKDGILLKRDNGAFVHLALGDAPVELDAP